MHGWYLTKESFPDTERQRYLATPGYSPETLFFNPDNLKDFASRQPLHYRKVMIDLTWNCNFRCSYCNSRPADQLTFIHAVHLIETVERVVNGTNRFTIGNGMEPTIHPEFVDISRRIHELGRHQNLFSLQTNGRTLAQFSPTILQDIGFNLISISMDTFMPSVARFQRNGLRPGEIFRSIARILDETDVRIRLVLVITRKNIDHVIDFVDFCLQFGIGIFTLRQMITRQSKEFFQTGGKTFPIRDLIISTDEFNELRRQVAYWFDDFAEFEFYDSAAISRHGANTDRGRWQAPKWNNYLASSGTAGEQDRTGL